GGGPAVRGRAPGRPFVVRGCVLGHGSSPGPGGPCSPRVTPGRTCRAARGGAALRGKWLPGNRPHFGSPDSTARAGRSQGTRRGGKTNQARPVGRAWWGWVNVCSQWQECRGQKKGEPAGATW